MTSINTFEDILQAMEQNPALRDIMRRHLLTEELLQLPARVSRLEELVADIATKLAELTNVFTQFMEQTNLALARLNERQDRLEDDVSQLKEGQTRLETDVAQLKEGQTRLETDVAGLKEGQTRLETDVAGLKEGQTRLEQGQIRMSGQLSNLIGSDYERKAARLAARRLRQQLGISSAELLQAITVPDKLDLPNLLN